MPIELFGTGIFTYHKRLDWGVKWESMSNTVPTVRARHNEKGEPPVDNYHLISGITNRPSFSLEDFS